MRRNHQINVFKLKTRACRALALAVLAVLPPAAAAAEAAAEQTAGNAASAGAGNCPFGRTLKVAVYQPGTYIDFQKVFLQTALALSADGYLNAGSVLEPDFAFDAGDNYRRLALETKGGCFEFLPDGFYNGRWHGTDVDDKAAELKARVKTKGDVDLIWALGTVGGLQFADSTLGVPVMVMTPSDPESAGIIGPGEFSDKPNIHVQKEINRTKNELTMFHRIFKFKNLGIIIDDDPENWAGQSLPALEETSKELGVNLVRCTGPVIDTDVKKAQQAYSKCIVELAGKCDAVYLSLGNGASPDDLFSQIKPLIDRQIPTFSQAGGSEVQAGALLSLSDMDLRESGAFEARVAEAIYQGRKPEQISQYYYAPLNLNLNLETARLIDWKPDFELLMAIDQVYQTIKRPQQKLEVVAADSAAPQSTD